MVFLTVLFASVSATQLAVTAATGCRRVNTVPDDLNVVYKYENLHNETASTLDECVEICRSFPMCEIFSFDRDKEACHIQLMDVTFDADTSPSNGIYSSTMDQWNHGPCSAHACTTSQRCHPTGAGHVCMSAYDVCFRLQPGENCFRQYENFEMGVSVNILGSDKTVTTLECVRYCTENHQTFESFVYEKNDRLCTCRDITVGDYEQQNGPLVVNADMDIYSK